MSEGPLGPAGVRGGWGPGWMGPDFSRSACARHTGSRLQLPPEPPSFSVPSGDGSAALVRKGA